VAHAGLMQIQMRGRLREVPFLFYGHRIGTGGASVIRREIIRPWGVSSANVCL
jgi:hypothetical protein